MNKNTWILFLILLLAAACSQKSNNNASSTVNICPDCGGDSINKLRVNARTPTDSFFALMAGIDNFGAGPRGLNYRIGQITELIKMNERLNLIDIGPYEFYRNALELWTQNERKGSIERMKQAIDAFDRQKKIMGDASILNGIRLYYSTAGLQKEREEYYIEKLRYYQENGPVENTATCYHALAGSYIFKADYDNGISNYLKAAEIYKPYSPGGYSNEINAIGRYYYIWGNYDRAKFYMDSAIILCEALGRRMNICESKIVLSIIQKRRKEYTTAIANLDEVILISDTIDDHQLKAISLAEKAGISLELNKSQEAFTYLKESRRIRDSLSFPLVTNNGDLEVNYYLYKYYRQVHNIDNAEAELNEAFNRARTENDYRLKQKYRKELSSFYKETGREAEAAAFGLQYIVVADSLQSASNSGRIASYENEQKEIKKNLEVQQLQHQKNTQRTSFIIGGAFLLLFSIGIYSRLQFTRKVKKQLEGKNMIIEQEKLRTEQSLQELKSTQAQLIQSEKMASLGEMTAGIAHEIQNPLNFVNNFSDVSNELLDEMNAALEKGNTEEAKNAAHDVKQNLEKILYHGKRADAIVKSMLQHSRSSAGKKELTDINALADEYLRLAYHGLRAKDKSFNAKFETNFDDRIEKINVVQQDIGRVILNLINNAFYAVSAKAQATTDRSYTPTVTVSTKKQGSKIEIRVKDNGDGIPPRVLDKIFQPFFTTKPTGQGTGLGLSLSYDIITKGHQGELKVETKEGEGSEFIIQLSS